MKILAFAASNSTQSINRALVEFAAKQLEDDILPEADIEFLDINDYEMPIYSPEREANDGIPEPAKAFFAKIGGCEAVIVSFAEHNGSATAAWKNIFDWMSRIDQGIWQDKPLILMAASPGPRAGAGVLGAQKTIAPFFKAQLMGDLGVGTWYEGWDKDAKTLTRPEDLEALRKVLETLKTVH